MLVRPVSFGASEMDFQNQISRPQSYRMQEAPVPAVSIEDTEPKKSGFIKKAAMILVPAALVLGTLAYGSQHQWFKLKNNGEGFMDKIKSGLNSAGEWTYKKWSAASGWVKGLFSSEKAETVVPREGNLPGDAQIKAQELLNNQ